MQRLLTRIAVGGGAVGAAAIWGTEAVSAGLLAIAAVTVWEAARVVWRADLVVTVRAESRKGKPPDSLNGRQG